MDGANRPGFAAALMMRIPLGPANSSADFAALNPPGFPPVEPVVAGSDLDGAFGGVDDAGGHGGGGQVVGQVVVVAGALPELVDPGPQRAGDGHPHRPPPPKSYGVTPRSILAHAADVCPLNRGRAARAKETDDTQEDGEPSPPERAAGYLKS